MISRFLKKEDNRFSMLVVQELFDGNLLVDLDIKERRGDHPYPELVFHNGRDTYL